MDKKRFNEILRTGAQLEEHELLQGYHYCGDWDFDLITPGSPEEECCNCAVGHYYRALRDGPREGVGEEGGAAELPAHGEGNAGTLPTQGEVSAAQPPQKEADADTAAQECGSEIDDVTFRYVEALQKEGATSSVSTEADDSTDNWKLDLNEPGPLVDNFLNFIDLLLIYDLRIDSDSDSIVTVTPLPEDGRDQAVKVGDTLADHGWLGVEVARFVVKRYPVYWTANGLHLGAFVKSTHYTPSSFGVKANPLESQDKQKGPSTKSTDAPHSTHYRGDGIEPIDLIESQGFGVGFCAGNCIKYISRFDKKGTPLADVRKALWYGQRLLELLEKENEVDGAGS